MVVGQTLLDTSKGGCTDWQTKAFISLLRVDTPSSSVPLDIVRLAHLARKHTGQNWLHYNFIVFPFLSSQQCYKNRIKRIQTFSIWDILGHGQTYFPGPCPPLPLTYQLDGCNNLVSYGCPLSTPGAVTSEVNSTQRVTVYYGETKIVLAEPGLRYRSPGESYRAEV